MTQNNPQEQQLKNIASQQQFNAYQSGQEGQQLLQPLLTGTLPPAAQAMVNQILQSNLAGTRTNFGNIGLSNSTMEQSAEQQAQNSSLAQTFGIEEDMAKLGQQYTQLAAGDLSSAAGTTNDILSAQTSQDTALMAAIGNFGKALGGAAGMKGLSGLFGGGSAAAGDAAAGGTADVADLAITGVGAV